MNNNKQSKKKTIHHIRREFVLWFLSVVSCGRPICARLFEPGNEMHTFTTTIVTKEPKHTMIEMVAQCSWATLTHHFSLWFPGSITKRILSLLFFNFLFFPLKGFSFFFFLFLFVLLHLLFLSFLGSSSSSPFCFFFFFFLLFSLFSSFVIYF